MKQEVQQRHRKRTEKPTNFCAKEYNTKLRNSIESFNSRLEQAGEKKSMSSNIDLLKLFSQRNKKNKRIKRNKESQRVLLNTIKRKCIHHWSPRSRGEGDRDKKLI